MGVSVAVSSLAEKVEVRVFSVSHQAAKKWRWYAASRWAFRDHSDEEGMKGEASKLIGLESLVLDNNSRNIRTGGRVKQSQSKPRILLMLKNTRILVRVPK